MCFILNGLTGWAPEGQGRRCACPTGRQGEAGRMRRKLKHHLRQFVCWETRDICIGLAREKRKNEETREIDQNRLVRFGAAARGRGYCANSRRVSAGRKHPEEYEAVLFVSAGEGGEVDANAISWIRRCRSTWRTFASRWKRGSTWWWDRCSIKDGLVGWRSSMRRRSKRRRRL